MLPTTQKIAMGRQNHVPVLHHQLPIYGILYAPHPIKQRKPREKKKKTKKTKKKEKIITNTDNTEAENTQITTRQSTRSPLGLWEHPSTG